VNVNCTVKSNKYLHGTPIAVALWGLSSIHFMKHREDRQMKKMLMMLILVFMAFTASAGYSETTIFLDDFENGTAGNLPGNPQIGTNGLLGSGYVHQIVNEGGNLKLQSSDTVNDNAFAIYNRPIYEPLSSTTTYDFRILSPSVINTSLVGKNAFLQELILNNAGGDNLLLYWGDDYKLRLDITINGGGFWMDLIDLNYTWAYGTNYHIEWEINGAADTYSLTVNGTKLQDNVAFGDDIYELYAFSYGTNYDSIGTQVMDNVTIKDTAAVPEPAVMLLLGLGLTGLAAVKRRMGA
jgi:hypothetical protein